MEINDFNLKLLCDLAGVTSRTVSYYIQQGILPHAGTSGRAAKYERRHLMRLKLVKLLQREHQPLAQIRKLLQGLTDDQVAKVVAETPSLPAISSAENALDYTRHLLAKDAISPRSPQDTLGLVHSSAGSAKPPVGLDRSQWDRVVLTRDVELHIRRPLTRERNRRVERLLNEARRIMTEDGR